MLEPQSQSARRLAPHRALGLGTAGESGVHPPREIGVAFLARTILLKGGQVLVRPRLLPLQMPAAAVQVPVVRLESDRADGPDLSAEQRSKLAAEIAEVGRIPGIAAVQVDFDARESERAFYRQLLEDLRRRLPSRLALSMTALASWCVGDDWLSGLPVDEAAPMLFRRGADDQQVRLRRAEIFSPPSAARVLGFRATSRCPGSRRRAASIFFAPTRGPARHWARSGASCTDESHSTRPGAPAGTPRLVDCAKERSRRPCHQRNPKLIWRLERGGARMARGSGSGICQLRRTEGRAGPLSTRPRSLAAGQPLLPDRFRSLLRRQLGGGGETMPGHHRGCRFPVESLAPYLEARSLVRRATLIGGLDNVERGVLTLAETRLQELLADRRRLETHPAVRRLLDTIRGRLRTQERLQELAQALLRRGAGETVQKDLEQYTRLLDQAKPPYSDELTDWVRSFQASDTADHAVARWRQTSSLAWLVAALAKLPAGHTATAGLLAAVEKIQPGSPAFATVAFHSIPLLREAGRTDEARNRLDSLLTRASGAGSPSTVNLLQQQRVQLARNIDEFLRYVPLVPVSVTFSTDNEELPMDAQQDPELSPFGGGKGFLNAWEKARDPAARHFAAILLMLRRPGARPYLGHGVNLLNLSGRTALRFRWNQWCWSDSETGADSAPPSVSVFLSVDQKTAARLQLARLAALGPAPNFLCRQAIEWAQSNPRDPLAPEALHLAVAATRYGCGDKETSRWSRAAFHLLHRQYPQSPWAAQTKYGY